MLNKRSRPLTKKKASTCPACLAACISPSIEGSIRHCNSGSEPSSPQKLRPLKKIRNMKAAVLHQLGQAPKYEDFSDPVPQNADQLLIDVKAAPIKNLDKGRASGAHYAPHTNLPE